MPHDDFLIVDTANRTVIHALNTFDGDGTWADPGTGDVANIATEADFTLVGAGSVEFDIDVSASGDDFTDLENSTFTAVDLSQFATDAAGNRGARIEADLWIPGSQAQIDLITTIQLRLGSDSTNYTEFTTQGHYWLRDSGNPNRFIQGWNRLVFDWNSDTPVTGAPANAAIDYARLRINYGATQTDIVDLFWSELVACRGPARPNQTSHFLEPAGHKILDASKYKTMSFRCEAGEDGSFSAGQVVFEASNSQENGGYWQTAADSYTPYAQQPANIPVLGNGHKWIRAKIREDIASGDTGNYRIFLVGERR